MEMWGWCYPGQQICDKAEIEDWVSKIGVVGTKCPNYKILEEVSLKVIIPRKLGIEDDGGWFVLANIFVGCVYCFLTHSHAHSDHYYWVLSPLCESIVMLAAL